MTPNLLDAEVRLALLPLPAATGHVTTCFVGLCTLPRSYFTVSGMGMWLDRGNDK